MSVNDWSPQRLKERLYYQGRKFRFEVSHWRLPNGIEREWECIRHPGGALAVPITPEGKFVLVNQYRFALKQRLLEFPAGTVESEEQAAETIKRELAEETGYRAHQWQTLGKFSLAPGYSDEFIYAFLATELERLATPPEQDEDEDIEIALYTWQDLEKLIHTGEANLDAKSITSYYLARPFLEGIHLG